MNIAALLDSIENLPISAALRGEQPGTAIERRLGGAEGDEVGVVP